MLSLNSEVQIKYIQVKSNNKPQGKADSQENKEKVTKGELEKWLGWSRS